MPDKPLTVLDFRDPEEVSIVDQAANKRGFPVWKNKKGYTMDPEILKAVMENEVGDEKNLEEWITNAKLSEKGAAAVKAAFRILGGFKDEIPEDVMTKLAGLVGMTGPPPAVKKEELKSEPKPESEPEPLAELPEEVRKALAAKDTATALKIKTLEDNNTVITKALEEEKDARDLAGWVEKAKTDLSHYPGESSEEIAKALHKMHKVDPGLAESQCKAMKAASDALRASAILKSAGNRAGQTATGSAWGEIEKLAAGIVKKSSGSSMTRAQTVAHVLRTEQGQALYTQYEEEQEV